MADVNIIGEVPASSPHQVLSSPAALTSASSSSSDLSAFKCDDIEHFLNSFQPGSDLVVKMEPDACPIPPDASPSSPLTPAATDDSLPPAPCPVSSIKDEPSLTIVARQFEVPRSVLVFNHRIFTSGYENDADNTEIFKSKETVDLKEVQATRFPPDLISCYGEEIPPSAFEGDVPASVEPGAEKVEGPSAQSKVRRKRRKQRFSLLEVKKFYFENGKERELLLPDEYDLKTAVSKVLPGRDIPFVYRCRDSEEHDCAVKCAKSADNFKLYMSIGPNNGTLPPPIVSENILSNLRQDSTVVDETSALIAATALQTKNQPNFRIFLPMSDHILQNISIAREIQNGPLFDVELEIDDSVRAVVDKMVEFVDRQSNAMEPDYDPDDHESSSFDSSINDDLVSSSSKNMDNFISDNPSETSTPKTSNWRRLKRPKTDRVLRELKKLANVSIADESSALGSVKKSENCTELFCKLGCVCDSLSIKPPPSNHCGNSDCIFGCLCGEKPRYVYVPIEELAKNEKSWHQTVIRKGDNRVEIQSGIARRKRATKAPERFDDWNPGPTSRSRKKNAQESKAQAPKAQAKVEEKIKPAANKNLGKIDQLNDDQVPNKVNKKPQKKNWLNVEDGLARSGQGKVGKLLERMKSKVALGETAELDERTIKKLSLSKKLVYCRSAGKSAKSLADVFIYCSIHNVYDCECDGWIVMMKNGDMLLKSAFKQTQMMDEALRTISLSNPTSFRKKAMVYDLARHSARTAPPIVDFPKRNKSKIFRKKSSVALSYGVPSYTNSYLKVPPVPLVSYCEDEAGGSNPSFLGTDAVDTGVGRIIKLCTKGTSESEKFKVVDDQTAHIVPSIGVVDNSPQPHGVDSDSGNEDVPQGTFTIAPPKKRLRPGSTPSNVGPSKKVASSKPQPKCIHHKQIKGGIVIDLSSDDSSDEKRVDNSIVISDDDEGDEQLPDFGMFCQSHPYLGYVSLENRGNGYFGVRGFSEQIDKFSFSEIKQVSEFLKQFLDHTGYPKYANSKWVKVTKGVLQLKKCSKFEPGEFLVAEGVQLKKSSAPLRPPQQPLQELKQQQLPRQEVQQVSPKNLLQQRLTDPVNLGCITQPASPGQPMQRIHISGGTVAPQSLQAGVVLPVVTQTATLVARTSPSTVPASNTSGSTVVKLWTQPISSKPVKPPQTADVIIPLNERTIKFISPMSAKFLPAPQTADKSGPVAYLCNKKQLPSTPVKSLLANRKHDDK